MWVVALCYLTNGLFFSTLKISTMQIQASFGALLALVSTACAMPTFLQARSVQAEEKMDAVWRIHESCNGTQRAQIQRGVDDMHKLASSSIAHLVNHPRDAFFTKYFGEEGDPASVIGYFEQLISVSPSPLSPTPPAKVENKRKEKVLTKLIVG